MTRSRVQLVGLLALVVVLAGVLTAAAVTLLPGGTPENPQLTAYSDGEAITVPPTLYCDVGITSCEVGATATLPVPAGRVLQVSLPGAISEAPWRLLTVFTRADGTQRTQADVYRPDDRIAVTVGSTDPTEQLSGIEVQLPSSVLDSDGLPRARATWGISTDPAVIAQVQGG